MIYLTVREHEVLELWVNGCMSYKEMAYRLGCTLKTIDAHCFKIREKLGAHCSQEVCKWYWTVFKK